MTTARDIVNAALRRANVVGTDETPSAAEAAETLERLNDYMASWPGRDWVVTDSAGAAYTHADLTLATTWPLGSEHVFGIKAILAMMHCEEYGTPIPPSLASQASKGVKMLQADFFTTTAATMPALFIRAQKEC